jgi:hypothetical protein
MVAEVLDRESGSGSESLLADAATRLWAGLLERADGLRGGPAVAADIRLDVVARPDRAAREVLVALGDDLARWDLEMRTERTYWETGGHLDDDARVRVTASGWADASAWRLRGGLSGVDQGMFAQGGAGDGIRPGALLGVLLERAVTGSPEFGSVAGLPASGLEPEWMTLRREQAAERGEPGPQREPDREASAAASASREAGAAPVAGIPGVPGAGGVRSLSGDELLGAMAAAQRMANRAEWARLAAVAEFARRRHAETQAAAAEGKAAGQRAGEFFCEEVSWASCESARKAEEQVELAVSMAVRLRCLGARMAEGALDSNRLLIVHRATAELSAGNARLVDAVLAPDAPGLTPEALRKRAWRLVLKLEPEAAGKRRKKAKDKRRVEIWMEDSGNAALAGRELDPGEALAANSYYDAIAQTLRKAGVPGTLRELRHLAFVDRNTGRNPLDRIDAPHETGSCAADNGSDADNSSDAAGRAPEPGAAGSGRHPDDAGPSAEELRDDGYRDDEPGNGLDALLDDDAAAAAADADDDDGGSDGDGPDGGSRGPSGPGTGDAPSGDAAPSEPPEPSGPAASIHILVPAGTVLGWSAEPGDLSGLGPVDAAATRDLVRSAARNPATRWHVTVVDEESGEAVAHACARGRHPWTESGAHGGSAGSVQTVRGGAPEPTPDQSEQTGRVAELLNHLGITGFEPIARGSCDHAHREDRYVPSRKLGDLIRARTATCPAPCCGSRAVNNDLDHTRAYPEEPGTCECNLAPPCRRHHRVKQAPGWKLEQVSPGHMRWTTPSRRVYETHPTVYDL